MVQPPDEFEPAAEFDPTELLFGPESEPNPAEFLLEPELPSRAMLPQTELAPAPAASAPAPAEAAPAPADPLHALKAMSEAERIALFS